MSTLRTSTPEPLTETERQRIFDATGAGRDSDMPDWLCAGRALREHHGRKRHRTSHTDYADYDSFSTFCREALELPPKRAYVLMGAAHVASTCRRHAQQSEAYAPRSEPEATALVGLSNRDLNAVATHLIGEKNPTTNRLREVVLEVTGSLESVPYLAENRSEASLKTSLDSLTPDDVPYFETFAQKSRVRTVAYAQQFFRKTNLDFRILGGCVVALQSPTGRIALF